MNNPFQTVTREEVGNILKITPQITDENTILLKIEQEVSGIAAAASQVSSTDLVTNKRTISTRVLVDDGGMIVLGGLIEDRLIEGEQRIPILGRIPLIGNLFRVRNTQKTKTNLMVFIHPVILRDSAVTEQNTNSKYNYFRAIQLKEGKDGVNLLPGKHAPVLPEWGNTKELGQPPLEPPPAPKKDTQQGTFGHQWWYD